MRTGTRASLFRGGSDVLSHPQRRQSSRTAKTYHTIVSKFVHSLIFVHSSLAISLLFLYIIRLLSLVMSLLSALSRTLPFSWTLLSFCLYRFLFLSFETDFSLLSFSCIRHFFYHYSSSLIFIFYVPAVLQRKRSRGAHRSRSLAFSLRAEVEGTSRETRIMSFTVAEDG